jgi:hypothetical protein
MPPLLGVVIDYVLLRKKDNYNTLLVFHLYIEEILFEICAVHTKNSKSLKDANLTFYQLLCLAKSYYPEDPEEWIWIACEKLNSIRNSLAHRLDTTAADDKLLDFLGFVEPHGIEVDLIVLREGAKLSERLQPALAFLSTRFLMILGPDEFKTYGDKFLEAWTIDGTITPPQVTKEHLLGTYESVSESEWHLAVKLEPDNSANITLEEYEPGNDKFNVTSVTEAIWESEGALIRLKYKDAEDVLCYDDSMPLKELGMEGGAPGISQAQPFSNGSLIKGHTLWKSPLSFLST